eukprot:CAMPEP_0173396870 /NCGR_PEP_ID=MMETSP1356-20130122/36767_1 /TAXON_ID=77927 ORGANISM="Hemiselmis virescens, Strain PCC157" /NCGR_SAMPLE_ID=MMETSP1356 /ASSEMBLY_ACC=CAM_ASM_000847 /LENGTH=41 /DNA_ID= /DNA_START= /DNA_END= /DNA_ORIENTATION=
MTAAVPDFEGELNLGMFAKLLRHELKYYYTRQLANELESAS